MQAKLLINGQFCDSGDRKVFVRENPVNGGTASVNAAATVADAIAAADAAAAAQDAWGESTPGERRALLSAAADMLQENKDEIIAAMEAEIGATKAWAAFNVKLGVEMFTEAAAMTTQISGSIIPADRPGTIALATREPAGVCLGIAPWNAPIVLAVRAIAMPLACGNAVILKTSEKCPVTHMTIGKALHQAGFPAGVVNVIANAPEDAGDVVGALVDHPAVRRINYTGSTETGRIIAQRAARNLKPVLLELGGKSPCIILRDADLDAAVKATAFAAFMNQGQVCMSTERIIVEEDIADAFIAKFVNKAKTLTAGDPRSGTTPLGAVADDASMQRINELVQDAKSKGADILCGGEANGTLMSATVIDRISSNMRIYEEETFGPVVTIIRVKNSDEAIRVANDTQFGLTSAIFTKDVALALKLSKRIKAGMCHINGPTIYDEAQMPFGGTKDSGFGRFGGQAGIDQFTELKWVSIRTDPGEYPL